MKILFLIMFIPSFIAADILCPNSKTTCPEEKECCEVDEEYSCCDPDDDQDIPARRLKVFPGVEIKRSSMLQKSLPFLNDTNLSSGACDDFSCGGTCCSDDWGGCCKYSSANCCSDDTCCSSSEKCCENGCCDSGYNCCDYWCCKEGYRCGNRFMTCHNKAVIISPKIVALLILAASVFVSYHL